MGWKAISTTAADSKESISVWRWTSPRMYVALAMLLLEKEELTLGNNARVGRTIAATIGLFVSRSVGLRGDGGGKG